MKPRTIIRETGAFVAAHVESPRCGVEREHVNHYVYRPKADLGYRSTPRGKFVERVEGLCLGDVSFIGRRREAHAVVAPDDWPGGGRGQGWCRSRAGGYDKKYDLILMVGTWLKPAVKIANKRSAQHSLHEPELTRVIIPFRLNSFPPQELISNNIKPQQCPITRHLIDPIRAIHRTTPNPLRPPNPPSQLKPSIRPKRPKRCCPTW